MIVIAIIFAAGKSYDDNNNNMLARELNPRHFC